MYSNRQNLRLGSVHAIDFASHEPGAFKMWSAMVDSVVADLDLKSYNQSSNGLLIYGCCHLSTSPLFL